MKNSKVSYDDVLTTLLDRKDQWVKAPAIIKAVPELKSDSQVRQAIHYLRAKSNEPIISSSSGYMHCSNRNEVIKCLEQLKRRAKNIRKAEKGLKKALKGMKKTKKIKN